jgi:uncharacterized membrane protein
MNATIAEVTRGKSGTWTTVILGGAAMLAGWFIFRSASPYFNISPDQYGPYFWPRRWGLVLHVAAGVIALSVGVVQLWLGLTNRIARLHRALGKLYVGTVLLGSMAGFYLALTIPGNPPYAAGLFTLCVAWVVTTSMAVLAIRRRNVLQHREWMMRSYAVTFAFVTFRFGVDRLAAKGLPVPDAQVIMAWACWAMPLLLLEPLLQIRRMAYRPANESKLQAQ